jgi:hypothetical protein
MKSIANVFIRISLTVLFCLGMLITANPAALARDRDRDRGGRERCQTECQERYKEQSTTVRTEEARSGTDASKEQIGNIASAKIDADN